MLAVGVAVSVIVQLTVVTPFGKVVLAKGEQTMLAPEQLSVKLGLL